LLLLLPGGVPLLILDFRLALPPRDPFPFFPRITLTVLVVAAADASPCPPPPLPLAAAPPFPFPSPPPSAAGGASLGPAAQRAKIIRVGCAPDESGPFSLLTLPIRPGRPQSVRVSLPHTHTPSEISAPRFHFRMAKFPTATPDKNGSATCRPVSSIFRRVNCGNKLDWSSVPLARHPVAALQGTRDE